MFNHSKMMSTGVSAFGANAQTDMMKAIVHSKQCEDQQTQIKSRIIKLMKEEEKANKRIKDLSRRQEFVSEMHKLKAEKFAMQANRRKIHQDTEAFNRTKFNEIRNQNKTTIKNQFTSVY